MLSCFGIGLFVVATLQFYFFMSVPEEAQEVFVTGKQWMWKYQHPNGRRQINNVTVPVDTPIRLTMTSEDVIHAFWVPAFRIKQDVVPGRYTTVWFEATKTGVFRQLCAEYCGSEHSLMGGTVTDTRMDTQFVVTEYGCVDLKGLSLPERARALIGLAHPDFRENLEREARASGIL